jgi:hypothetical protein
LDEGEGEGGREGELGEKAERKEVEMAGGKRRERTIHVNN